jgi:hypothetical protein
MNNKTDWFPPEVKPVRDGVYETIVIGSVNNRVGTSYWDGTMFSITDWSGLVKEKELFDFPTENGIVPKQWRGIKK